MSHQQHGFRKPMGGAPHAERENLPPQPRRRAQHPPGTKFRQQSPPQQPHHQHRHQAHPTPSYRAQPPSSRAQLPSARAQPPPPQSQQQPPPLPILGSGSFGTVRKLSDAVVEKTFHVGKVEAFRLEAAAARRVIGVPNILQVLWVSQERDPMRIHYELASHGTLLDIINQKRRVAAETGVGFLRDATNGVNELHNRGILHRDLKPENMLVKSNGHLVIGDLGTLSDNGPYRIIVGTHAFLAPEALYGNMFGSKQIDIYALGMSFFMFFFGIHPLDDDNLPDARDEPALIAYYKNQLRLNGAARVTGRFCRVSEAVCILLERTLDPEPGLRPTAPQMLQSLSALAEHRIVRAEARIKEVEANEKVLERENGEYKLAVVAMQNLDVQHQKDAKESMRQVREQRDSMKTERDTLQQQITALNKELNAIKVTHQTEMASAKRKVEAADSERDEMGLQMQQAKDELATRVQEHKDYIKRVTDTMMMKPNKRTREDGELREGDEDEDGMAPKAKAARVETTTPKSVVAAPAISSSSNLVNRDSAASAVHSSNASTHSSNAVAHSSNAVEHSSNAVAHSSATTAANDWERMLNEINTDMSNDDGSVEFVNINNIDNQHQHQHQHQHQPEQQPKSTYAYGYHRVGPEQQQQAAAAKRNIERVLPENLTGSHLFLRVAEKVQATNEDCELAASYVISLVEGVGHFEEHPAKRNMDESQVKLKQQFSKLEKMVLAGCLLYHKGDEVEGSVLFRLDGRRDRCNLTRGKTLGFIAKLLY